MTYKERVAIECPDAIDPTCLGGVKLCPANYHFLKSNRCGATCAGAGPGTLHINGTFLGEIKEAQFEPTDEEYELQRAIYTLLADTSHEGTMEWVASLRQITFLKLCGSWQGVMKACPNKRIVHLMKHGKNDRVKLKNYKRAWREIGKDLNRWLEVRA